MRRAARARAARRAGAGSGFTTRVGADVDPSAVVFASRAAGEDWFCFEQPDRDGSALAALGTVARLTASGAAALRAGRRRLAGADRRRGRRRARRAARRRPGRARRVRLRARRRPRAALGGLRGRGPGRPRGRARAPRRATCGSRWPRWPRPTTCRRSSPSACRRAPPRCAWTRCRCSTPRPPGASGSTPWRRPSTTRRAVARAVEKIRAGAFEKIVLAREVTVHAPTRARRRRGLRRAARGLRVLLRLLRRPRRRRVRRRLAGAADPPRRRPRADRRAGRLDAPLRRPRRRRPPRRAAAALRQGPRGAGDRRPADRPRAAPARRLGRRARRARR